MGLNGSDIRDTADTLTISPATIMHELQKRPALISVNQPLLSTLHPSDMEVTTRRVDDAEVDKMWSFGGKKQEPRWL